MIYHVEVTSEDFANAKRKDSFDCAFARAISRATGKLAILYPEIGTPGKIPTDLRGYNLDLFASFPSWMERRWEADGMYIYVDGVKFRDLPQRRKKVLNEEWAASRVLYRHALPEHVVKIIRAFDFGDITPTNFSFPLYIPGGLQ